MAPLKATFVHQSGHETYVLSESRLLLHIGLRTPR